MGRSDDKIRKETTKPAENGEEGEAEDGPDLLEEITEQDVETLSHQLDELNDALDVLEQVNENIQSRILELLQSSRELRVVNQHTQENDR